MDSWQQSVPEGMTTKSEHLAVSDQPMISNSFFFSFSINVAKTQTENQWKMQMYTVITSGGALASWVTSGSSSLGLSNFPCLMSHSIVVTRVANNFPGVTAICDTTALHKVDLSSSYHNDCTSMAFNFNALSSAGVLH